MKKTVWVLSLIVMLLSQVFTPFAYAVSGEDLEFEEKVPEVVTFEVIPEVENLTGELDVDWTNSWEVVEPVDVEINNSKSGQ